MTLSDVLFYLLAGLTGFCALGVVVTQNIVRAAAWLLFALAGTAGVFFLLGADFVGATQLLVYVGGTLVLVVFGVMLTAQGPFINMRIGAAEWLIALSVGGMLYAVLAVSLLQRPGPLPGEDALAPAAALPRSVYLGAALLGDPQASPEHAVTGLRSPPEGVQAPPPPPRRRMSYLLPFEIVSVHLLVVLLAAAYLARAKRRLRKDEPGRGPPERGAAG
jgi:NADH-quinone oxidoreductase subunit J